MIAETNEEVAIDERETEGGSGGGGGSWWWWWKTTLNDRNTLSGSVFSL